MANERDVLDAVWQAAPVVEGQRWAVIGVRCLWWTTFPDDVKRDDVVGGCCPYCGGPVEKMPLAEFIRVARHKAGHKDYEKGYGPGGLATLMQAHHRQARTCRLRWDRVRVGVDWNG